MASECQIFTKVIMNISGIIWNFLLWYMYALYAYYAWFLPVSTTGKDVRRESELGFIGLFVTSTFEYTAFGVWLTMAIVLSCLRYEVDPRSLG